MAKRLHETAQAAFAAARPGLKVYKVRNSERKRPPIYVPAQSPTEARGKAAPLYGIVAELVLPDDDKSRGLLTAEEALGERLATAGFNRRQVAVIRTEIHKLIQELSHDDSAVVDSADDEDEGEGEEDPQDEA